MKTFSERRFVCLHLRLDELVLILKRHGYLPLEIDVPDLRANGVMAPLRPHEVLVLLESDQLPDAYRWKGCYASVRPAHPDDPLPVGLRVRPDELRAQAARLLKAAETLEGRG
jgi:hypothetical protein